MKTIEQFLRRIMSQANWDYDELVEHYSEGIEEMTETVKEFLKEVIKEDRKNVAEHAQVDVEYRMGQKTGYVEVDKDSIINAPIIELK